MKKIKFKKWPLILKISTILFGGVSVLWLIGILIQFINATLDQDYSMFYEYGQIALTVFGFTLIGGIFEDNKKDHSEIVKKLYDSSLSFLITAISFFFLYSISSFLKKPISSTEMNDIQIILIFGAIFFAMIIAFSGIISGLLRLYQILVAYRIKLNNK